MKILVYKQIKIITAKYFKLKLRLLTRIIPKPFWSAKIIKNATISSFIELIQFQQHYQ